MCVRLENINTHHSLDNLAEDNMAPVKPASLLCGDEELRAVGILARVCHGEPARAVVGQLEVLISKFRSVDTSA